MTSSSFEAVGEGCGLPHGATNERLTRKRILIADSSPLFRQGVKLLLEEHFPVGTIVVLEAGTLDELRKFRRFYTQQQCMNQRGIDLVVVDGRLGGLRSFNQMRGRFRGPRPRVLMMAEGVDESLIRSAYRAGIEGVIDKQASADQFCEAINAVINGVSWLWKQNKEIGTGAQKPTLSNKQSQVYLLLQSGMSNKQIAAKMHISENTVKYHVTQIYKQSGLENPNRIQLAMAQLT